MSENVELALPWLRRLTVDIRIEARAAGEPDCSPPLSPLVAKALQEFLDRPEGRGEGEGDGAMRGKFESSDGLDVSWRALNLYYHHGRLCDVAGVDEAGRLLDGEKRPGDVELARQAPVPMTTAHLEDDGRVLNIGGLRFALDVFEALANPDAFKLYRIRRNGAVVVLEAVEAEAVH